MSIGISSGKDIRYSLKDIEGEIEEEEYIKGIMGSLALTLDMLTGKGFQNIEEMVNKVAAEDESIIKDPLRI